MASWFKDKILQIKKLSLKMNPEVICFCVIIIIYDSLFTKFIVLE